MISPNNRDGLQIFSLNIRSLRANFNLLNLYLDKDNLMYDVIMLTETWIGEGELGYYQIPGYSSYISSRIDKRSGGTVIYIKNELIINNVKYYNEECNAVQLTVKHNNKNITLVSVYRDCGHGIPAFLKVLHKIINACESCVVIAGDFNINILDPNKNASLYLNCFSAAGFREISNGGATFKNCSKIDHFWIRGLGSNCDNFDISCSILDLNISDHKALFGSIQCLSKSPPAIPVSITKKKINYTILRSELNKNLKNIDYNQDTNSVYNDFHNILSSAVDNSSSLINPKSKIKKRSIWASNELLLLSEQKNKLYHLIKKYPDSQLIKQKFKEVSKNVIKKARVDKQNYYDEFLEKHKGNIKEYWKLINNLVGRKRENIKGVVIEGRFYELVGNENKVTNAFNEYFGSVAKKQSNKSGSSPPIFNNNNLQKIDMPNITGEMVNLAIEKLGRKFTVGYDGISSIALKEVKNEITDVLCRIFNKSLATGVFPDQLKKSVVVPVLKVGDASLPGNYRPISLLPVIAKIFELIIKNFLTNFLLEDGFFAGGQFGFLPGHCTEEAIFQHIKKITGGVESGLAVAGIYLDIAKAFDTVDHDILLGRLQECGLPMMMIQWFKSFLSKRKMMTKIGMHVSDEIEVERGIPQGGMLGPLLFLIYINNIFSLRTSGTLYSFADDTALVCSAPTVHELAQTIQNDLNVIAEWFDKNKLNINPQKTKIIHYKFKNSINNQNQLQEIYLKENNQIKYRIEVVKNIKYLGTILEDKLTWDLHIKYIEKKLRKINYTLYNLKKFLKNKNLIKIYKTFFQPVVRYNIINWGGAAQTHKKKIFKIQKQAVRICLDIHPGESVQDKFPDHKILSVNRLCDHATGCFLYRYAKCFEIVPRTRPSAVLGTVEAAIPGWNRYHSRMQLPYRGPLWFNNLENSLREKLLYRTITYNTFSKKLKDKLLNCDAY